jgi:hypothetical protein
MDSQDRNAIDQLFERIANVQRQAGPRDSEAEAYLRAHMAQNPAAAYYMAQTIIVQEQALNAAQARIDELEQQPSQRAAGGGLLENLFGGSSRASRSTAAPRRPMSAGSRQPWGASPGGGLGMGRGMGGSGGGFLAGAAQTAMGVAGGVVLGNMLADWLSPDQAAAAGLDQDVGDETDPAEADAGDAGGDFDGGDFDVGDF